MQNAARLVTNFTRCQFPHQSTDAGARIASPVIPEPAGRSTFLLATLAALEVEGMQLEDL
jgi:hypothetical protein